MSQARAAAQLYCHADLNYSVDGAVVPVRVGIDNGRMLPATSWQQAGFELLQHPSSVTDWNDQEQIEARYYTEMAALARSLTDCRQALVTGHILRNPEQARTHSDYAPIEFVHSDFTETYGRLLRERYAGGRAFEAAALVRANMTLDDLLNAKDLMILQFWRNVGPPVMDRPLALCDARTVPATDLRALHVPGYAGSDFAFDTFAVTTPSPDRRHHWSAFPAMHAAEVVALRTFDSRRVRTGEPFWTPHSAFADPTVAADAPPRASIELRVACLF